MTTSLQSALEIPEETRLKLFRTQVELREFEKRAQQLFLQNLVKNMHLGIGQEAVAAGFVAALRPDDYMYCSYRGHNHVLARGAPMTAVLSELFGRATGTSHGKSGSNYLTSVEHHAMGSYGVVGAQLLIANGAAWSAMYRKSGQVTACFFGDGATNTGAFHEALNLAAVWKLPIVFICENNRYMLYTRIESVTAVKNPAADRAGSYGLPSIVVDGNDADACYAAAQTAYARARSGGGPSMIEAGTYRMTGHSCADPSAYQPQAEREEFRGRDPIDLYRKRLVESGVSPDLLVSIEAEARAAVDRATAEAKAAPVPSPEALETNVWADGGSTWRN